MRKIYVLPNLFTSGNLFCGVLAMVLALEGKYVAAAGAILAGLVFDFWDGVAARLQRTSSRFGLEYDSMADLVTFGVAPMVLLYALHVGEVGGNVRTGLGVAFLYVACTALRLARFNVHMYDTKKISFSGLPSPAAGGVLASLVIAMHRYGELGEEGVVLPAQTHLLILVTLPLAFLMVSTLRYPALVHMLRARGKRPFVHLVIVLLALGGMVFFIEAAMFVCFAGYTASGPVRVCYRALLRKPALEREPQPAEIARFSPRKKRRRSTGKVDFPGQQGEK